MQNIRGETHGISVIVGAIMLTLIVVTAATSYAIFLDDQQKKIQASEALELQRSLENLTILALDKPVYHSNPGLVNVSFIITNINAQETTITSMNLNNRYIREFIIDRQSNYEKWNITAGTYQIGYLDSNGTWIFRDSKKPPSLQPREQIILTIYDIENNTIGDKQRTIAENEAITLNIFTGRTNIFSKTFYPPTAIILIKTESQWNSSSNDYMPVLILDGSLSNNPSRDSYIMSWNWKIDNTTLNNLGEKVRAPDILFDGSTHTIYLTVTNNFGMTGTSSITYS